MDKVCDFEPIASRLIRERMSWERERAAEVAVSEFRDLLNKNMSHLHQRAALETIWKKQVNRSNLFGGIGKNTAQLSPSQVRLGSA